LLERLAHQLKGAAGSYGFPQVTPVAARLEQAARERRSTDAMLACLSEMADLCVRICFHRSSAFSGGAQ
jgi:HPt (histidine-containing phosphotransfer) domain-containing protein